MTSRDIALMLITLASSSGLIGCLMPPGKPALASVAVRPEQTTDFPSLYAENCASCHGEHGRNGAAISLANPVYGAIAGASRIQQTITKGLPGTMMPAFAKSGGGTLTEQQIAVLAQGVATTWGNVSAWTGQTPPPYAEHTPGDPVQGQRSFTLFCASCHGATAEGSATTHLGSLVNSSYLALISNQGFRSIILAGRPDEGMPDWRNDTKGAAARPMTDQEVTDTVAWLVSHRGDNLNQQRP